MKKLSLLMSVTAVLLAYNATAQNEMDALRYSQLSYGSTALSLGLGGAGGSMGADFSGLSVNPATIGVYRRSEVTITPALQINSVNSKYINTSTADNRTRFTLGNFGLVWTDAARGKDYKNRAWKSVSFGVGYNRLADFNQRVSYSGYNDQSSITEIFANSAQQYGVGSNVTPPWGFLGYEGYVLDDNLNPVVPYGDKLLQRKKMKTSGSAGEFTLSLGGNYKEKLLLGATIGIQAYDYKRDMTFSEDDASGNDNNNFSYLDYMENLHTSGIGGNIKIGAIYVVNNMFRVGVAFHSPTWSAMADTSFYALQSNTEGYKASINADNGNPESYVDPDAAYTFKYGLRTPWHTVLSATALLNKYGMITADYEMIGYNSMHYRMRDDPDYATAVNESIKNTFKLGHAFRVGAEGRLNNFMGRLGFAYYTSPFKDADLFDGDRLDLSVGMGIRFADFFIDAAYMHSIYKVSDYAYPGVVKDVPVGLVDMKYGNNVVALTFGVKL